MNILPKKGKKMALGGVPQGRRQGAHDFQKFSNFLKKWTKMGHRRAPGGANIFLVNIWGRARRGDPVEKKDGAKILIFHDFRFLGQNGPRSAPNDAQGPNLVGID